MPKFFVSKDQINEDTIVITGNDVKHINVVLRKSRGDSLRVCDSSGTDFICTINDIDKDRILLKIESRLRCLAEPTINVTLYQAMVKGDKSDAIIQKSVELGVSKIAFFESEHCVSRPDKSSLRNKLKRWQAISEAAAKQSGRGIIPEVCGSISFLQAVEEITGDMHKALLYEGDGTIPIKQIVYQKDIEKFSFLIGPEGGFSEQEINLAKAHNIPLAGLGKRILRTETASSCVLSVLMYETGNL